MISPNAKRKLASILKDEEELPVGQAKILVAIDFGTTSSACAWLHTSTVR
jgi:hypothetical protein